MSRILVVSSKSYEKARADGICGKNLKEGFHSDEVFLLGYADLDNDGLLNRGNNEFEFFYQENKNKENKLMKTAKRLIKPFIDNELVKQYEKHIEDIIQRETIDTLVAVFFPLETVVAVSNIKMKYPRIKTIIYEVDSSTDVEYYLSRLDKYYIEAYKRFMKKLYKYYDYVLVMNSHYKHVVDNYGKYIQNKLHKIDSPVLCHVDAIEKKDRDSNTLNFFYTGTFVEDTYSPEPFFEFFNYNKEKKNWRLHLYSKGCESLIKRAQEKDERIIAHGYVSQEELNKAVHIADIFLSIESKYKPNSIPSKVFKFFYSNKPVLHFSNKPNIFTEEYMTKYPMGYVANISNMNNEEILSFIDKAINGRLEIINAEQVFEMNKPEYSADLINNLIRSN